MKTISKKELAELQEGLKSGKDWAFAKQKAYKTNNTKTVSKSKKAKSLPKKLLTNFLNWLTF